MSLTLLQPPVVMLNSMLHQLLSDYFAYLCPKVIVRRNCPNPLNHCCKGLKWERKARQFSVYIQD